MAKTNNNVSNSEILIQNSKSVNKKQSFISNSKSAFTLVELIVVIVILAILATIAFLSFSSQSGSARDSTRLSDIASLKKGFEMYNINSGIYPTPDSPQDVTFSGGVLWTQGVAGDNVYRLISKTLSKKVSDPISSKEYTYSLANNKREFQIHADFENPLSYERNYNPFNPLALSPELSALGGNGTYAYITGNYNGLALKIFTGNKYYIVPTPGMIVREISDPANRVYDNNFGSGKLLMNGSNGTTTANFNSNITNIYSSGSLPTGTTEVTTMMTMIQSAYISSNITTPVVQQIVSASGTTLDNLGAGLVKNSMGGSAVYVPPAPVALASCTFSGNTVTSGNSMTLYSETTIAGVAAYSCTDRQSIMTCNNGILSGDTATYKYTNCVKGVVNNCTANASYSFSGHTYSIPSLNHGVASTNIYSSDVSINNGIFKYKLNSVECNDGTLINASENATAEVQSCNATYSISGNACVGNPGNSAGTAGTSCQALKTAGMSTNGIYWIKPDAALAAFQIYCDMNTNGGGWTIIFTSNSVNQWKTNSGTLGSGNWSKDLSAINMPISSVILIRVPTGAYKTVNGITKANLYSCSKGSDFWWNGTLYNTNNGTHLGISNDVTLQQSGNTGWTSVGSSCNPDRHSWGFGHNFWSDVTQGYGWDSFDLGTTVFSIGIR